MVNVHSLDQDTNTGKSNQEIRGGSGKEIPMPSGRYPGPASSVTDEGGFCEDSAEQTEQVLNNLSGKSPCKVQQHKGSIMAADCRCLNTSAVVTHAQA